MQKKSFRWWLDFVLVCSVLLLAESARGVVIGTLSPYLSSLGGDSFLLGVAVAVFSVGRLIASFVFGALSDYWSTRTVLAISCIGCVIGDFLFCFADTFSSAYVVLVSRILTGFGTGMLSVARTHVSVTTPTDERTLWMSWLGIIQFVGFAITPVFGNINVDIDIAILHINNYTFAALILAVLEMILLVCLLLFMSNRTVDQESKEQKEAAALAATKPPEDSGNQLVSDAVYHQLEDDGQVNDDNSITRHQAQAERQASVASEEEAALAEEEKEVFLEDDVVIRSGSTTSTTSSSIVDTPKTLLVSGDAASLDQREVIVYMESTDSTRNGQTLYIPHHFVFNADPSSNTTGTLIPRAVTRADAAHAVHPSPLSWDNLPPPETKLPFTQRMVDLFSQSTMPLVFVVLNLSGRGVLSVAEAYGTQMYNRITDPDNPSPSPNGASTFFLIMGCCGLVVFLGMSRLTKYINENILLLLSFVSMGIGFGVLVDFDEYDIEIADFAAGMSLIWIIGTPISQTLSVSMLSRYFTEQQKKGNAPARGPGFWMGLVTAAGSVGRIIFPLVAGSLYEPYGISSAMLFTSVMSFLTILLIVFPLKTYRLYLPFCKDKVNHCCPAGTDLDDDDDEDEEEAAIQRRLQQQMMDGSLSPLSMMRHLSLDKTEMIVMENGKPRRASIRVDEVSDIVPDLASAQTGISSSSSSSTSSPPLHPVVYMTITPQAAAGSGTATTAAPPTPLNSTSSRRSSFKWTAKPLMISGSGSPISIHTVNNKQNTSIQ